MARLKHQIGANRRLRLGLWLALGILWLYGILELKDALHGATMDYHSASKKIARARADGRQTEWPERAEQATILRSQLEGELWRAATVGLAQASLQDWLNGAAQQTQLSRPSITASAETEDPLSADTHRPVIPEDLIKVKAKAEFDFNPQTFNSFMLHLASHDRKIIVESLTIRTTPLPRVEILLAAYFQKQEGKEQKQEAPR